MLLRIGAQRDLLVAVSVDSARALEQVRTLFAAWLEPDAALAAEVEPAFTLVLGSPEGSPAGGARSVPQVRLGSVVMMRSREPNEVLQALAKILGGVHVSRRDDGRTWMGLRPFVRGGLVVLVDADRPALVNDPQLARIGVGELPVWSVVVESDGSVWVPPALTNLAWESVGIQPPSSDWFRFQLVGLAVLQEDSSLAEGIAALAMRSTGTEWFATVASLAESARVSCAADRSAMRNFIDRMLRAPTAETHFGLAF